MTGVSKVRHSTRRTPSQLALLRWIASAPVATRNEYRRATGVDSCRGTQWTALENMGLIHTPPDSTRAKITDRGRRALLDRAPMEGEP